MHENADERRYACVLCVGGRTVQTRSAIGQTFKDLRDVLYVFIDVYIQCTYMYR